MYLNMSSGKWRPFCHSLNVLTCTTFDDGRPTAGLTNKFQDIRPGIFCVCAQPRCWCLLGDASISSLDFMLHTPRIQHISYIDTFKGCVDELIHSWEAISLSNGICNTYYQGVTTNTKWLSTCDCVSVCFCILLNRLLINVVWVLCWDLYSMVWHIVNP